MEFQYFSLEVEFHQVMALISMASSVQEASETGPDLDLDHFKFGISRCGGAPRNNVGR